MIRKCTIFLPFFDLLPLTLCPSTHTVTCSKDTAKFFAGKLYKSMKGAGTDDETLIRVMVSRCEVDMENIKTSFKSQYGKTLYSFIKVRLY